MAEFRTLIPEVLELKGLNGETQGRTVLMHTPTMTIVDVAKADKINFDEGIAAMEFDSTDSLGHYVKMRMGVHCSCGLIHEEVKYEDVEKYMNIIADAYNKAVAKAEDNIISEVISDMN